MVLPEYEKFKCPQCSSFDCVYRDYEINFNGVGAYLEKYHITLLFQNIWTVSYKQTLTPCISRAVCACITACRRSKSPGEHLSQFYDLHLEGHSLPVSIILHTLPIRASKVNVRCTLLRIIVEEIPLTAKAREELYQACIKIGSNDVFSCIRLASQRVENRSMEFGNFNGKGLRLRAGFVEDVKVTSKSDGSWLLQWFIPDMLQRLRSNMTIHTEFFAQGHIWHVSLSTTGKNGRVLLGIYRVNSSKPIHLSGKFLAAPNALAYKLFGLSASKEYAFSTKDPRNSHTWEFYNYSTKDICKHINQNGGCYVEIRATGAKSYTELPLYAHDFSNREVVCTLEKQYQF